MTIPGDRFMYCWRSMTAEQRAAVLAFRQQYGRPWHGPPHYAGDSGLYLITAACYEHRSVIGCSPRRMAEFESDLLNVAGASETRIFAWVVLPNHYHQLVHAPSLKDLSYGVG